MFESNSHHERAVRHWQGSGKRKNISAELGAEFLANSEKVAYELERAQYHDKAGFQAVASRVMMAHCRDLAQMAAVARVVSGGQVLKK